MTVYYTDDQVTLHHGRDLDVLRTLPDQSVNCVVTSPPRPCQLCGTPFTSRHSGQLYCCRDCSKTARRQQQNAHYQAKANDRSRT